MTEAHAPTAAESSEAITLLEKLAETRLLVLGLALIFHIDIWLIYAKVDPKTVTMDSLGRYLQQASLLGIIEVLVSFSLLIAVFFPGLRVLLSGARLRWGKAHLPRARRSLAARRLSDWAFAFVAISAYDLGVGLFRSESYQGLGLYVIHMLAGEQFEAIVLRLASIGLWIVCIVAAMELEA